MDLAIKHINGCCHCGAVRFHAELKNGLHTASRCNCSICRMRGAVVVTSTVAGFTVLSGAEHLRLYQFNTETAKHYFCSRCGIYTHHQRRSNPNEVAVNVACLEGLSPFDFVEVPVSNGARHTSDGHAPHIAGVLRYLPNTENPGDAGARSTESSSA